MPDSDCFIRQVHNAWVHERGGILQNHFQAAFIALQDLKEGHFN